MSELRYHPFLNQWVITATHRQDRTFLPPEDYCPLCPTKPGGFPTEVPFDTYDIVVFENKFPSMSPEPPIPAVPGTELLPVRPSHGVCEVICYSEDHDSTFATLPLSQVRKLARVWRERTIQLGARPEVEYVFIFENKGKEIGVTLSHPHGQIYAYPFLPPVVVQEVTAERRYYEANGRPLMQDILAEEGVTSGLAEPGAIASVLPAAPLVTGELVPEVPVADLPESSRVFWQNRSCVAFVPFFARYPYEIYVTTKTHVRSLAEMDAACLDDLAETLHTVARKLDGLFGFSMPYIMAMHQAPAKGEHPGSWFHVEFYPPYRTATKLKYLAGSEAGAGAFINDTLPEETARTLRATPAP